MSEALEPRRTHPSSKKSSWRRAFVKAFILTLLVIFVKTCSNVHDQKWTRESSVYDIQREVQLGRYLQAIHGFALKAGFSDESWLLRPLLHYTDQLYKEGIAKIPETDSERVRLWYIYKFWPYKYSDPRRYVPLLLNEVEQAFTTLSTRTSHSPFMSVLDSQFLILDLAYYLFEYRDVLPRDRRDARLASVAGWLNAHCASLTKERFANAPTPGIREVPLSCARFKLLFQKYMYTQGLMCAAVSPTTIRAAHARLQELWMSYQVDYKDFRKSVLMQQVALLLDSQTEFETYWRNNTHRCNH